MIAAMSDAEVRASTFAGGRAGQPLRVNEAAELLRVTPQAVLAMIERGELCATKVGKSWLVWLSYEALFSRAKLEQEERRQATAEAQRRAAEAAQAKAAAGPTREELEQKISALEERIAALPEQARQLAEEAKAALVAGDKGRADTLAGQIDYLQAAGKAFLLNRRDDLRRQLAAHEPARILEELQTREENLTGLVARARVEAATDQPGREEATLDPAMNSARRLLQLTAELANVRRQLAAVGAPERAGDPLLPPLL